MTEPIPQNFADTPGEIGTTGLDEAFKFIGELARQAAQGDETAQRGLDCLYNLQLAANENLRLKGEVLNKQIILTALANSVKGIAAMRY